MLYKCPRCGRTVDLPEGNYYCRFCGSKYPLVPVGEGGHQSPQYPEEVKHMRGWIWSIYHAVEERDWERLLKDNVFNNPRFIEDVRKAERYYHGRYGESLSTSIEALRRHVERRDATEAFREMVEILLCLEPAVPWMH